MLSWRRDLIVRWRGRSVYPLVCGFESLEEGFRMSGEGSTSATRLGCASVDLAVIEKSWRAQAGGREGGLV